MIGFLSVAAGKLFVYVSEKRKYLKTELHSNSAGKNKLVKGNSVI